MLDSVSGKTLSPAITDAVRRQCDEFEASWQAGKMPMLDDYLGDLEGPAREYLIRELAIIEQRYRSSSGAASALAEMTLELPTVAPSQLTKAEPAAQLEPSTNTCRSVGSQTIPTQTVDNDPTIAHSNETMAPTGRLVIRCPHCCNGVELLAETPFEDITCHDCGSTFNLVDREKLTTAAAPRSVGRFRLEKKLGTGGFGTVWLARDSDLDRVVAIKIPRKGQLSPIEMEQFYREARAAAQLRHPNIVPVHEVGRDGDTVFIVSDFIEGESLSDWMNDRRMGSRDVAQLAAVIAGALHHAHQQGIIHRDFKPSNVMIDGAGEPHLMDFGLARREVGEVTMTVDGQILGTPTYMSPEQASGQGHWADRRTDVYSFGVMLFKMLTDELPFRGSIQRQIQQRLTDDAPDPRTLNRFIPRDLATIVLKCLERDPNKRYLSAAAVAEELRRFLRGEPIKARPISRVARIARWAKRKPAAAIAVALAAVLAVGGPLLAWNIERQRRSLAHMLTEKNNMIKQGIADSQRDGNAIKRLEGELAVWTGRENPWKFWPPDPKSAPRKAILEKFFTNRYEPLAASLVKGNYDKTQLVAGNLGLGLMAKRLNKNDIAKKHLLAAEELLDTLSVEQPANVTYQVALAQCLNKLAQLYGESDRKETAKYLAEATAIQERLSKTDQTNPAYKIDWLETELTSGVLGGFDKAGSHLKQAAEIEKSLSKAWPTDPLGVYNFAAYLTEEAPVLVSPPAE